MVRQVQSSSNAGTFTNGMPMTSSMGCGIWGGNITNENVSLKHYMNVTWVSRPIRRRQAVGGRALRRVLQQRRSRRKELNRHGHPCHSNGRQARRADRPETRIASYLLTDYLERLGVEVIFGLCGHTVIGFLDALGKSNIRFISTRHEQVAAHAADGYARASGKVGVLMTHLGPGPHQCRDRCRQCGARFDSDGRDRRRHPDLLLRPPSAPGSEPAPGRGSVPDLPAVLQARLSRRQRRDLPRIVERAFHLAQIGPARARAGRRADGHLLGRSRRRRVRDDAARDREVGSRSRDRRAHRRCAGDLAAPGAVCRRRRAVGARDEGTAGARRGAAGAGRAHADGEGLPAARASAAARAVRFLGHADRQREVPHRRSDRRRSARGSPKRTRARGIRASPSRFRRRG